MSLADKSPSVLTDGCLILALLVMLVVTSGCAKLPGGPGTGTPGAASTSEILSPAPTGTGNLSSSGPAPVPPDTSGSPPVVSPATPTQAISIAIPSVPASPVTSPAAIPLPPAAPLPANIVVPVPSPVSSAPLTPSGILVPASPPLSLSPLFLRPHPCLHLLSNACSDIHPARSGHSCDNYPDPHASNSLSNVRGGIFFPFWFGNQIT